MRVDRNMSMYPVFQILIGQKHQRNNKGGEDKLFQIRVIKIFQKKQDKPKIYPVILIIKNGKD